MVLRRVVILAPTYIAFATAENELHVTGLSVARRARLARRRSKVPAVVIPFQPYPSPTWCLAYGLEQILRCLFTDIVIL
jgi:hypothetical protein